MGALRLHPFEDLEISCLRAAFKYICVHLFYRYTKLRKLNGKNKVKINKNNIQIQICLQIFIVNLNINYKF